MMTLAMLNMHYTPEEAHQMLRLLDELRDAIWENYREEIIEYCRKAENEENHRSSFSDVEDDTIPF